MTRLVIVCVLVGLVGGCPTSCVPSDVAGCPLEPAEAVGAPCFDEGIECGETSLCDPCTSDLADCALIACTDGTWEALDVSGLVCSADGGL